MTAPPDETTTDLHAVIVALGAERDAGLAREAVLAEELAERTAELGERNSEYGERIDHQVAIIDVLKVMSVSPDDPQPVFDLIVRRAAELCNGSGAGLLEFDGKLVHYRSGYGTDPTATRAYAAIFPMAATRGSIACRAVLDKQIIHIRDMDAEPDVLQVARNLGMKSNIAVPLMRDGAAIGALALTANELGGFSDSQVALLQTFAEQAVIAISSAETYRTLQTRTSDLQESLEYQTATSDVLKVISRSTFDLQLVLDTLSEAAARLCEAEMAWLTRREGETYLFLTAVGSTPELTTDAVRLKATVLDRRAFVPGRQTITGRVASEALAVQIVDIAADPEYTLSELTTVAKIHTLLGVPMMREGVVVGTISLARQRVEPFTDRQIELVSTFADQAVIAIENTRLLTEQREALEQQTATAEVLQVINASPGNLTPVFDAMLEKAMHLCGAAFGELHTLDGDDFRPVALLGIPAALATYRRSAPAPAPAGSIVQRIRDGANIVHTADAKDADLYRSGEPTRRALVDLGGARTVLTVALRKDEALLGFISIYRQEVRLFTDRQIALLTNFAAQAVIAMENARLLGELRARTEELAQRQAELRVTFENMGDGVAMFDETPSLVAWNRKFQDILDLPDGVLAERLTFSDYIRYLTERGEYGEGAQPEEQIRRLTGQAGEVRAYERTRPDGRVIEIRRNPVPSGGFVLIFSDITKRKRNEAEVRAARDAAEEASRTIEAAYRDLKAAQANLIQAEKMASLGQLTAGIAHEIKNPLNFVNNFAELSVDLLGELKDAIAPAEAALNPDQRNEVDDVVGTLTSNLEKITEHGKRADGIVKAMLEHSRGSSAERRTLNLNTLVDEALNLAYHGARAQDQSFNITLERYFADWIAPIEVNPQDMTRVFLNLFSNGFYAATRRARNGGDAGFVPTLKVTILDAGDAIDIRIWDNGTGIPADIRDKLFQPFFTTKPTGEGTGLGLSITYDIVTKQHGGSIAVDSKVGEYSEFTIRLPRNP